MVDEMDKKRVSRTHISESERMLIEYLWNNEHYSQSEIGRRLGYRQSSIARELERGNVYDFSHLDRRTLLSMDIHARIKYSAMRGQYIATKNKSRIGQGTLLTPELKELIEYWVNVEHWTPEQIAGNVQDVNVSASAIRNWARHRLIHIRTHKYHGADVKIMDRFFRHREVPDSENFSKPGFQLKTA